jgi:hypothetical protein
MRRLPSSDDRAAHDSCSHRRACADLADSTAFNLFILANAVVLGLETYES